MKKRMLLVASMMVALFFSACSCDEQQSNSDQQETTVVTSLEVDEVLAQGEALVGETVTVQGVCTHVCSHGGGRLFLMGSDDTQVIRVEAGEEIGAFPAEVVNGLVTATGELVETRIDEAYLQEFEARLKAQEAENNGEEGEAGCEASARAAGADPNAGQYERIAKWRAQIAEREAEEGKAYLSFFHIAAKSYELE